MVQEIWPMLEKWADLGASQYPSNKFPFALLIQGQFLLLELETLGDSKISTIELVAGNISSAKVGYLELVSYLAVRGKGQWNCHSHSKLGN